MSRDDEGQRCMNVATHHQLAGFIWRICNLLRGPFKPKEYGDVILPLTVLRRFDCVLAPTKTAVLEADGKYSEQIDTVRRHHLEKAAGVPFYNTSSLGFEQLLNDPNMIADNLHAYIRGFSPNVRDIMDRFGLGEHIARMNERGILYEVVRQFASVDLSPDRVDNIQMGYVFEELIRVGAEHSKDEAGDHFTPREVIRLMVSLLLSPEPDLGKGYTIKKIYDPAAGTGGMLSAADDYLREHNSESKPLLFGQDWNPESWAVCKSDMLIKGDDAERIILGDTFVEDGYKYRSDGSRWTFDYMLANPPFGVEWKVQKQFIEHEHKTLGYDGRFGAGLPAVTDGSLLFLQHMLSKMEPVDRHGGGGSRIAIVFNGSPLFAGGAGRRANRIRRWIIENDWLEAVVALPDQMFYNTGISTYIWVLTNRKEPHRVGKVQLIDGRQFFVKMRKSLGQETPRTLRRTDRRPHPHPRELRGRRNPRPHRRGSRHPSAAHKTTRSKQDIPQRRLRTPRSDRETAATPELRSHPRTDSPNRGPDQVPESRQEQETSRAGPRRPNQKPDVPSRTRYAACSKLSPRPPTVPSPATAKRSSTCSPTAPRRLAYGYWHHIAMPYSQLWENGTHRPASAETATATPNQTPNCSAPRRFL